MQTQIKTQLLDIKQLKEMTPMNQNQEKIIAQLIDDKMAFVKQTIKTGLEKISIIAELLVWQKKKIIPREEPRFRLIKTQFTEITQKAISISIDDHADLRVELLQLIGEIKECLKICKNKLTKRD